jgi:hypothetical protein
LWVNAVDRDEAHEVETEETALNGCEYETARRRTSGFCVVVRVMDALRTLLPVTVAVPSMIWAWTRKRGDTAEKVSRAVRSALIETKYTA